MTPPSDHVSLDAVESPGAIRVEPARPADAAAIVAVHYAAVHQTAATIYCREVLDAWSPPISPERVRRVQAVIEGLEEHMMVARRDREVVGFGSIVPSDCELRSLYVHPAAGRRGVGGTLLEQLEELAASLGLCSLQMDASINAEAFYLRHQFVVVERGVHRLGSGVEMACVRMRKELAARPAVTPTSAGPRGASTPRPGDA
jgi:N-acetylglutamate synthase-like GNAT family acetyltransferase